ncbi:hypothetical protein HK098_004677 [Nowakowskiella sp. JEL0407]|nr:hypothetical protein HK098_004677 [Nowakowskiella sp. JEL0407]
MRISLIAAILSLAILSDNVLALKKHHGFRPAFASGSTQGFHKSDLTSPGASPNFASLREGPLTSDKFSESEVNSEGTVPRLNNLPGNRKLAYSGSKEHHGAFPASHLRSPAAVYALEKEEFEKKAAAEFGNKEPVGLGHPHIRPGVVAPVGPKMHFFQSSHQQSVSHKFVARPIAVFKFSEESNSFGAIGKSNKLQGALPNIPTNVLPTNVRLPTAVPTALPNIPEWLKPAFQLVEGYEHGQVGVVVEDVNGIKSEVQGVEGCYGITENKHVIKYVALYPSTSATFYPDTQCKGRAIKTLTAWTDNFGSKIASVRLTLIK